MQSRSGTIQKIVLVTVGVFLLLLVVWFFLDLIIFSKKNHTVFAQFDATQIARRADSQCKIDTSSRCFSNFFANFAKSNKFEKTRSVLDELTKINKSVSFCHGIAHEISIAEVSKDPHNWLNVFSYVPGDICSAGFFHGVIEGKFKTDPNLVVNADLVDTVCMKQLPNIINASIRRCAHAFGHVITVQREGRVADSIRECRLVDKRIKNLCFQGVFMEHIQKDSLAEHGIEVRAKWDQKYIDSEKKSCESYNEEEQIECWRSLAPAILKSAESDHTNAVVECDEASLDLSKEACRKEVLGRLLVNKLSDEVELEEDYCSRFEVKDDYRKCLKDLINYVMLTSFQYKNEMEDYCALVLPEERESCLRMIKGYISSD